MTEHNVLSKKTRQLQKDLATAVMDDLKKLVGQAFLNNEDDEDSLVIQQFVLVEGVDDNGFIFGTGVMLSSEGHASIDTDYATNSLFGDPVSKKEFLVAMDKATAIIAKKIESLKKE